MGASRYINRTADTGEMERKARSRERPIRTARRGAPERSVRKVLATNLGIGVCLMSWRPGCLAAVTS